TPLLACQGITKRYGAILANDRVDFDVNHGEIHALVGENGAGKSTLVGCIYGLVEPDEGEVRVDGIPAAIRHPKDALALGIGLVQQHFVLVPPLSVAENIVLGAEPRWGIDFDRRKAEQDVADLCEKFGLDLDPSEKVERLSVGERQRVEIAKVLYRKAQILILDEPTAVLTPHESRSLLENLVRLKEQGLAVVLITHRIPETLSVADRVTVMRRGRVVLCREIKDLSAEQLAEAIVGESLSHPVGARGTYGGSLVEIHELDTVSGTRGLALKGISLSLREGEVLGIAGVSGNGQQELVDALLGLLPITSGTYTLGGKSLVGRSTGEIRRKNHK
ncbi:MAG TPA: ATP-binding cassette domain-containing protein, partial [bacterium]|nr:ATP-binding cassette domain-containing protein [bacterium]